MLPKEFKTIDEQINLLKSRGMIIPDEKKAKKYLLTNNYYNIINGYSKPFLKEKEQYLPGATFDEVSRLYFFDKELKQTLFNYILDAEHHLKSIFAYRFAETHEENPEAYLDIRAYDHQKSLSVAYIISKINRIISKNSHYQNNSINYYLHNYHFVPIWVLVDYLDFGDLSTLINVVPRGLQNKIANDLTNFIVDNNCDFQDRFDPKVMVSFIKNIHETRNICAHNNRLIYFRCRSDSKYFEYLHGKYNFIPDDDRSTVYSTFISLQCFISQTEYAKLNNTIRKRAKTLENHLISIDINSILNLLGFPNDWHLRPIIEQND